MKQLPGRRFRTALQRMLALVPLMLCAILLLPNRAHAQCTQANRGPSVLTFTMPATATIPRDSTLGTVIARATTTTPAFGTTTSTYIGVNCTADTTVVENNMLAGASNAPTSNNVIPTAIPGIGYQLFYGSKYYNVSTAALPLTFFSTGSCAGASPHCYAVIGGNSVQMTLQFVVTGPVNGVNVIPSGDVYQLLVGGLLASDVRLGSTIQITGQTCQVTTPLIPVTLGSVKSSTFTTVGSKSPAVPFTIGLNCSGVATNIAITFTDNNNAGNTSNILSLAPGTGLPNATGVGIQIVPQSTGTAVKYGMDSSVAGNANQIMLGASNSTNQSYAFTGQYISTVSTVTAGPANGVATFTMSYQ